LQRPLRLLLPLLLLLLLLLLSMIMGMMMMVLLLKMPLLEHRIKTALETKKKKLTENKPT
jgi:hypothetical protein